jgi:hypothetical protein
MEVDPKMEVNTIIEYAAFFFLEISKTGTCPARGLKKFFRSQKDMPGKTKVPRRSRSDHSVVAYPLIN